MLTRKNVLDEFPCFGHFNKIHCFNIGFIGKCPIERLCKAATIKYWENSDLEQDGRIDRPRQRLRELRR